MAQKRVTTTLLERSDDQLGELHTWTGLNKTDLVNRAISLYHFWEQQKQNNRKMLVCETENGNQLMEVTIL